VIRIALNVDVGEGFPFDEALLELADWGNVCCGAHAGSERLARETARRWLGEGRRVGAHPGYPHRRSMGRLTWSATGLGRSETLGSLLSQTEPLVKLGADFLKPHGALYTDSTQDGTPADLLVELLREFAVPLVGLAGSLHEELAARARVGFVPEGFADRRYRPDGLLVPRTDPRGVIQDLTEIESQTFWLMPRVGAVCVHGDHPSCVRTAQVVRRCLDLFSSDGPP
jgi:UPF0271 protein